MPQHCQSDPRSRRHIYSFTPSIRSRGYVASERGDGNQQAGPRDKARIVLTIIMVRPGQSEVDCSNEILETMDMPAELVDLHRIVLNLARSREFPGGSSRHGYDFIAPLDSQGHIDPLLWKKYRNYCRVRRFWAERRTRSVVSSTSPVAPNTPGGCSTTIPMKLTTMRPATNSAHMHFFQASMFPSADRTATCRRFAS